MRSFKGAMMGAAISAGAGYILALTAGTVSAFTPVVETGTHDSSGVFIPVSPRDARFMREAAIAGLTLIEAGELAAQRASHPAVRDLGRRLAKEDQNSIERLKKLAEAKGVDLPDEAGPAERQMVEVLRRTRDDQFDRAFLERMVRDHRKAVDLFEGALFTTMDPHLRSYVSKVLPTLRLHVQIAQGLRATNY